MASSVARILFAIMLIATVVIVDVNACCTCDAWCRGRGYTSGICADGPACLCSNNGEYGPGCTCDAWCRGAGKEGGYCCDGAACSCH